MNTRKLTFLPRADVCLFTLPLRPISLGFVGSNGWRLIHLCPKLEGASGAIIGLGRSGCGLSAPQVAEKQELKHVYSWPMAKSFSSAERVHGHVGAEREGAKQGIVHIAYFIDCRRSPHSPNRLHAAVTTFDFLFNLPLESQNGDESMRAQERVTHGEIDLANGS